MFKWIIIIIIGIAIWGGLTNAISFKSDSKNFIIEINKGEVINAVQSGFTKTTTMLSSIDKIVEKKEGTIEQVEDENYERTQKSEISEIDKSKIEIEKLKELIEKHKRELEKLNK